MDNKSEIKFPSNHAVTVDSIWRCLEAVAKAGKVFNKSQLIQQGMTPKNEDAIGRILNYIKYLGIIEENRLKDQEQKYTVLKNKNIEDMLYEMKANRSEEAKSKLKEYFQSLPLFILFHNNFFDGSLSKTFGELEYFLRDETTDKDSKNLQKGGRFLMDLFEFAGLVRVRNNDINIISEDAHRSSNASDLDEESGGSGRMPMVNITQPKSQDEKHDDYISYEDTAHPINEIRYNIRIVTPKSNHVLELVNAKDVDTAIYLLEKVKAELENGL